MGEQDKKTITKKWWFWVIVVLFGYGILSGMYQGITNTTSTEETTSISTTPISKFEYSIENGELALERYKGNDNEVVISDYYNIDGTDYNVTTIGNAVFNGCDAKIVYIPKTITCVYDNTLAYLNAEHIELYFEGTESEWNTIFKKYEASNVSDKWNEGDAKGAGTALADKLNAKIGHEYDASKFTYHYEAKIEGIK